MELHRILNGNNTGAQRHGANTVQFNLAELLRAYDSNGGFPATDLWQLRRSFASIVPFDTPNFLPRFSDFAISARELDVQQGRPTFQLGGFIPAPDLPVDQTPPVVLHPSAFRDFRPRPPAQPQPHQQPPQQVGLRLPPIARFAPAPHGAAIGAAGLAAINARQNEDLITRALDEAETLSAARQAATPSSPRRAYGQKRRHRNNKCSSRHKGRRRKSVSSSSGSSSTSDSSSSSNSEDIADNLPFTAGKNCIVGPLPSQAQAMADSVACYNKAGWTVSVERINRDENRPIGFSVFPCTSAGQRSLHLPGKGAQTG